MPLEKDKRILIASSDHALAKRWHGMLCSFYSIYDVDVHTERDLYQCLKKASFDVLMVDLNLLQEGGIHEISTIKELRPDLNIVLMVKEPNEREEMSVILFGAKAYCAYDISVELLCKVMKTVLSNELWVDRKFLSRLLLEIQDITQSKKAEAQRLDKGIAAMTARETQIAELVADGLSNRKIADRLNITERTVKAHLGVIFRKMGVSDRLQLALYMNRHHQIADVWHSKIPILDDVPPKPPRP